VILDKINQNQLRVFETVYRRKSMTEAAQELHLTQSGISQHIKALEDTLEIKLFDRLHLKLIPTEASHQLFEVCTKNFQNLEHTLMEIRGDKIQLAGTVVIGTPIEFGNSFIVPLLSQFSKKYPKVKFKLKLGFASAMNERLLTGDLDFAFVDAYKMDRRITVQKVYDEILELCVHPQILKQKGSPKHTAKYYENLEYVEYQEGEPILRMWCAHHLKTKHLRLNVKATLMDVHGVASFITAGFAAGILPRHFAEKLQKQGHKIYCFKGSGVPLKNAISVAYLSQKSHSKSTQAVLDFLLKYFKKQD